MRNSSNCVMEHYIIFSHGMKSYWEGSKNWPKYLMFLFMQWIKNSTYLINKRGKRALCFFSYFFLFVSLSFVECSYAFSVTGPPADQMQLSFSCLNFWVAFCGFLTFNLVYVLAYNMYCLLEHHSLLSFSSFFENSSK